MQQAISSESANFQAIPKLAIRYAMLCMAFLITSCATNVTVIGKFPTPIVEQFPYRLGLYYPPQFNQYIYQETNKERGELSIDIGSAQVELFNTLLNPLFQHVETVQQAQAPKTDIPLDLVLTITVDDFQYTVPKETKVDMYEVWIKYNIQVLDPQGALIADFLLSAYGKTPSEMLKGENESLNQAMIVALRDAGAAFIIQFDKVPEIKKWLSIQSQ